MKKLRLATVWLGGCSGCHMSFLDLDEWLLELAGFADVVFGPLMDVKRFPDDVDLTLVEGAVANEDNLEMLREVRANSRRVVSFGDCAVTGNVTALRNPSGDPDPLLQRVYVESPSLHGTMPVGSPLPQLLPQVLPLHAVVDIDDHLPGCPPSAARIRQALETFLGSGDGYDIRFG